NHNATTLPQLGASARDILRVKRDRPRVARRAAAERILIRPYRERSLVADRLTAVPRRLDRDDVGPPVVAGRVCLAKVERELELLGEGKVQGIRDPVVARELFL